MKKGNIILLVLSSIYTLVIEYMFYPEYIRYQEAGGLFLMTNDYLQGYLLAPTGWNSLITNFLSQFYHPLSLGLFVETGLLLITAVILLLYLRQWKSPYRSSCSASINMPGTYPHYYNTIYSF